MTQKGSFMKVAIDPESILKNPQALEHAIAAVNGLLSAVISFEIETQRHIKDCLVYIQTSTTEDEIPWRMRIRITSWVSEKKIADWEISEHHYCVLDENARRQLEKEVTNVAICHIVKLLKEPMLIGKPVTA